MTIDNASAVSGIPNDYKSSVVVSSAPDETAKGFQNIADRRTVRSDPIRYADGARIRRAPVSIIKASFSETLPSLTEQDWQAAAKDKNAAQKIVIYLACLDQKHFTEAAARLKDPRVMQAVFDASLRMPNTPKNDHHYVERLLQNIAHSGDPELLVAGFHKTSQLHEKTMGIFVANSLTSVLSAKLRDMVRADDGNNILHSFDHLKRGEGLEHAAINYMSACYQYLKSLDPKDLINRHKIMDAMLTLNAQHHDLIRDDNLYTPLFNYKDYYTDFAGVTAGDFKYVFDRLPSNPEKMLLAKAISDAPSSTKTDFITLLKNDLSASAAQPNGENKIIQTAVLEYLLYP